MPRFEGVWLINRSFGDDDIRTHYFPKDPGVIKSMEARGWEQSDLPADLDDDDPDFIEALEALKAKKTKKTKKTEPVDEAEQPADEEEGSE